MFLLFCVCFIFFFFKQKTAYEMRISDWSSDVCSSDLSDDGVGQEGRHHPPGKILRHVLAGFGHVRFEHDEDDALGKLLLIDEEITQAGHGAGPQHDADQCGKQRSEEHTSELKSLMRISYAVYCLQKKTHNKRHHN